MRKITDKKELVKLVSFIVMGDGGLYFRSGRNGKKAKNAYFAMNMIQDNEDYIDYCIDILENITNVSKYELKKKHSRKDQYNISTKAHPFFTKLHNRIYQGKYKGMDWHVMKMLDWESLAILYMSDGNFHRYLRIEIGMKNESYMVTLNLKRLSYGDIILVKKYLKDKLDLEWNVNKQKKSSGGYYYYLRLRGKDIQKFMDGIRPYTIKSFKYKLLDEEPSQEVVK